VSIQPKLANKNSYWPLLLLLSRHYYYYELAFCLKYFIQSLRQGYDACMFLTPKQETKPWYLHAFAACCSHFLLPVSTAIPSYENEAYDAKIVLMVENRLLISSIRKIRVPAEIQLLPMSIS